MKILYIITQADGGGAQKYVLQLARHFQGEIAAGTEASLLFEQAKADGLRAIPLTYLRREIHPVYDGLAAREIYRLVREMRPDIVHLNSSKAGVIGSIAAKLAGTKVVYTAHGFVFNEPGSPLRVFFYTFLEKLASYFRDHIIAVSEFDRVSALDRTVIGGAKITTIPNGILPIDFLPRDQARASLHLPDGKIYVGTVANLYATKGLHLLVTAMQQVQTMFNDIECVIIGEGHERKNLETQIAQAGLTGRVRLAGEVPDAARYLRAFDIFALPSVKEGFSYTLLEALQAGLPIIATGVGGNSEILQNGAGILVPPGNPAALAAQITSLALEYKLSAGSAVLKGLSEKARLRAAVFTQEAMLEKTESVYRQILGRN